MAQTMYQLVLIHSDGTEFPLFMSSNPRETELQRQRHVRSLSPGMAEVREVPAK